MEPGTAIAIGQVSAKVISIVWKYYSDVKDARSDITTLSNEVQDLRKVATKLEESIQVDAIGRGAATAKDLQRSLNEALKEVEELESELDPGTGSKLMRRVGGRALKWPFTKAEMEKKIANLQRFKSTMSLAMMIDQTSRLRTIDANIEDVRRQQLSSKHDDAFRRLDVAYGAMFDSKHQEDESRCLADTRVELLAQLEEWGMAHPQTIFWLSGMAGTGKSTISRTLATIFRAQNTLGGSFLFSRSSGEANNADRFVGTLAYSLCNVSAQLKAHVCAAITANEDVLRQGLRSQWTELIIGPLKQIKTSRRLTMNFVIDALDECSSDNDIRLLIQLFVELKDVRNIEVGLFVTSRPEVVIRLGFEKVSLIYHQKLDLRDVPREVVEHDILLFVQNELKAISSDHQLLDWPEDAHCQVLMKLSDCLFIFAATACRFIGDINWSDPVERLSSIIHKQPTHAAESGAHLADMYTQVLSSSLVIGYTHVNSTQLCNRFKEVVGTIVVLFDELSSESLANLLSRPLSWVAGCLSSLHSVLNIPDQRTAPIRLLHPSFRDFLTSERSNDQSLECKVDERQAHAMLTKKCFDVMAKSLCKNICCLSSPGSSPSEVSPDIRMLKLPQHVRYACQSWFDHLDRAKRLLFTSERCCNGEISWLFEFFQKDVLNWLEVMSLLNKMDKVIPMIVELCSIVEDTEIQELCAIVSDTKSFILENKALIQEAPLQAHYSAVIFSPSTCILRRYYKSPAWLLKPPSTDSHWEFGRTIARCQNLLSCITFASDGKCFAVLQDVWRSWPEEDITQFIVILNLSTGAEISRLPIPCQSSEEEDGRQFTISFSPDGTLATSGASGLVRLWNPVVGNLIGCIDAKFPRDVPLAEDFQASMQMQVEDAYNQRCRAEGEGREGSNSTTRAKGVQSSEHSLKSDSIASTSPTSERFQQNWALEDSCLISSEYLPNGDLAVVCTDSRVRIWDKQSKKFFEPLTYNISRNNKIVGVSRDGLLIRARIGDDHFYLLYHYKQHSIERLCSASTRTTEVTLTRDSTIITVNRSSEGTFFELIDPFSGWRRHIASDQHDVRNVQMAPNGEHIAYTTEGRPCVRNTVSGYYTSFSLRRQSGFAVTPDSKHIISLEGSMVKLWVIADALISTKDRPVVQTQTHMSLNSALIIGSNATIPGVSGFDLQKGKLEFSIQDLKKDAVTSSQNWHAFVPSCDCNVILCNRSTNEAYDLNTIHSIVDCIALSPDGQILVLVCGGLEKQALLWNMYSRSFQARLTFKKEHAVATGTVEELQLSHDNRYLLIRSQTWGGCLLSVWDVDSGDRSFEPIVGRGIPYEPADLATSMCAMQSESGNLMIFRLKDGHLLHTFAEATGSYVRCLAFSSDEQLLLCDLPGRFLIFDMIRLSSVRTVQHPYYHRSLYSINLTWRWKNDDRMISGADGDVCIEDEADTEVHPTPESRQTRAYWTGAYSGWLMEGDRKMLRIPDRYERKNIYLHHGYVGMFDQYGQFITMQLTLDRALTMDY